MLSGNTTYYFTDNNRKGYALKYQKRPFIAFIALIALQRYCVHFMVYSLQFTEADDLPHVSGTRIPLEDDNTNGETMKKECSKFEVQN